MASARASAAAATLKNKIYVMGGMDDNNNVLSSVEVYDITSGGSWTLGTNMITARSGAAASVVNGKIYVMGGMNNSPATFSSVEVFTPAASGGGSWTLLKTSMTIARVFLAAATVNDGADGDKLYVMGGMASRGTYPDAVTASTEYLKESPGPGPSRA